MAQPKVAEANEAWARAQAAAGAGDVEDLAIELLTAQEALDAIPESPDGGEVSEKLQWAATHLGRANVALGNGEIDYFENHINNFDRAMGLARDALEELS